MSLSNLTRMRSFSFSVVAFLILTVVSGNAALDNHSDFHEASRLSMTTSLLPDQLQAMPTNCLPDGNEPNDNPSQATPVVSTYSVQANFHSPADVDWYRYDATGGTWHSTGLTANGQPDDGGEMVPYILEVYDEASGQLVTNSLPYANIRPHYPLENRAFWFAPVNGSYLIKVAYPVQAAGLHSCGTSKYQIRFSARTELPLGETYQINGLVYKDNNWSGDWQVEEPPIESVAVRLLRSDGAVVATQSTNNDGVFNFMDVAAGQYAVEQVDLSGYVSTTSNRIVVEVFRDQVVYFGDHYLSSRGSLQFLPLQLKHQ